jgi:hypothetical protein
MNFVNCTPHDIVLRSAAGEDTTIPASGIIARVASTPGELHEEAGFPCLLQEAEVKGKVTDLPEPVEGTFYIVSALVGESLLREGRVRKDVLQPGTGPQDGAIRNERGHIVAVTRLKRAF